MARSTQCEEYMYLAQEIHGAIEQEVYHCCTKPTAEGVELEAAERSLGPISSEGKKSWEKDGVPRVAVCLGNPDVLCRTLTRTSGAFGIVTPTIESHPRCHAWVNTIQNEDPEHFKPQIRMQAYMGDKGGRGRSCPDAIGGTGGREDEGCDSMEVEILPSSRKSYRLEPRHEAGKVERLVNQVWQDFEETEQAFAVRMEEERRAASWGSTTRRRKGLQARPPGTIYENESGCREM
ncbi:hypothetical protein B0H11DRAFT_2192637 [Mycena galericulata]|nr:hypothetical protein B0H11DRAFT_2192637 [Mycena galericulata]